MCVKSTYKTLDIVKFTNGSSKVILHGLTWEGMGTGWGREKGKSFFL